MFIEKKLPMSAASMNRDTLTAFLRLYFKNRREIKSMKQRVKITLSPPRDVAVRNPSDNFKCLENTLV